LNIPRSIRFHKEFCLTMSTSTSVTSRNPVEPRHVGVGCVLFLPEFRTLDHKTLGIGRSGLKCQKSNENRPGRSRCRSDCHLDERGYGHPVIVLDIVSRLDASPDDILFVQLPSQVSLIYEAGC
jgi:hypothetical protein